MTKSPHPPKISVVMPIYNCAKFLEEGLASLLIQTFRDFEILAINDGSTDHSLDILKKFATLDNRIKIINQKNTGIVGALNRGIKEARGKYIARMDGDDICFSNRFTDQVAILDKNPKVVLVAGDFEVINQESEFMYRELLLPEDDDLKQALYLRNPIAHGSTMFRKAVVESIGGYRDLYGPTEDMDLWIRLSHKGEFATTTTSVYKWRMNQNGLTLSKNEESIAQSKAHIERRWDERKPSTRTRRQLLTKTRHYLAAYKNGVHYKHDYLNDMSQLAVKLFTHGKKTDGLKQLIAVASTGRVGLKIVLNRVRLIIYGRLQND
jgi:glycosyltransferase involved in cell wall biosynthesis